MTPALAQHLRDLGLLAPVAARPEPRKLIVRDVSWYARGEECPH